MFSPKVILSDRDSPSRERSFAVSSFHLLPLDVTTIHQQSSRFSGVWEQVHMPPFTMCARYCIALPLLMTVIVVSLRLAGSNSRKEHLRLMELLPGFLVSNMEKSTPSSCYPELTLTRMAWIHNVSRCVQRTRIVFRPSITNSYSFLTSRGAGHDPPVPSPSSQHRHIASYLRDCVLSLTSLGVRTWRGSLLLPRAGS